LIAVIMASCAITTTVASCAITTVASCAIVVTEALGLIEMRAAPGGAWQIP